MPKIPTWFFELLAVYQIVHTFATFIRVGFGMELGYELVYAIVFCLVVAHFVEVDRNESIR